MDKLTLTMTKKRAQELGLLTCTCGHPENNHFEHGVRPCAHCPCPKFEQVGIKGVEVGDVAR